MTFYLFMIFEPMVLVVYMALISVSLWGLRHGLSGNDSGLLVEKTYGFWLILCMTLFAVLAWLGWSYVFERYPLSMDEFLIRFQSDCYSSGKCRVEVPAEWRNFIPSLTPIFVSYCPENGTWVGLYLPVFAWLHSALETVALHNWLNPLLGAGSLWAVAAVAGKMWPKEKDTAAVAVLLLFSSNQFWVTSMSLYSMPAHLAFNLFWLWLYLKKTSWSDAVAPWIGVLAIGLHQPHVHVLFVLPFCWRLVLDRDWKRVFYYGTVYLAGCLFWLWWLKMARPQSQGLAEYLTFPGGMQFFLRTMNIIQFVTWQHLMLSVLVILYFRNWKNHSALFKDLGWSFLLTFGFYFFFTHTGGHGWGSRHSHSVLGNLVLMGAVAYSGLRGERIFPGLWGHLAGLAVVSLAVLLPWRLTKVHEVVAPFSDSHRYMSGLNVDYIYVRETEMWYGMDFVRNDPFLTQRPLMFFDGFLSDEKKRQLESRGKALSLGYEELKNYGVHATNEKVVRELIIQKKKVLQSVREQR